MKISQLVEKFPYLVSLKLRRSDHPLWIALWLLWWAFGLIGGALYGWFVLHPALFGR